MRALASAILATALYAIVIGTLIGMSMPTQARVEAYLDAAHSISSTASPATSPALLAG